MNDPVDGYDTYARMLAPIVPAIADHLLAHRPGDVHRVAVALFERALFEHVLRASGGNQLKTARLLGLNRNTVRKRGRELKLLPVRPSRRPRGAAPGVEGPGGPAAGS